LYKEEDLAIERWAQVSINDDLCEYKISDCGRVYLMRDDRLARPSFDQKGYPQIVLTKKGVRIGVRVHILVGRHFVDGYADGLQLNHIDGNKLNPHYSNLEWVTPKENMRHGVDSGLWKPFNSENHPTSKKVIDTVTGKVYPSASNASKVLKIDHLHRILRGEVPNNTSLKYYEGH
jgi:hypothetical protein